MVKPLLCCGPFWLFLMVIDNHRSKDRRSTKYVLVSKMLFSGSPSGHIVNLATINQQVVRVNTKFSSNW